MPRLSMLTFFMLFAVVGSRAWSAEPPVGTPYPNTATPTATPRIWNSPADSPQALDLRIVPNPAPRAGGIVFVYTLPRAGRLSIEIFDLRGQRLAVLAKGPAPAGSGRVGWQADNRYAQALAPGTYAVLMQLDQEKMMKKIVITP